MSRVHGVTGQASLALHEGWMFAATAPGAASDPAAVRGLPLDWRPALVPGTVASAERALGAWSFATQRNHDAYDWWYRGSLPCDALERGERRTLAFAGLASVADVWIGDEHVLASDNMFVGHEVDVTALAPGAHVVYVRFQSLEALTKKRRPRPRWRTRLVEQQNLRAFRTTLVGRVPAFTPPVVAVGPYLPIVLTREPACSPIATDVRTAIAGNDGVVRAALRLDVADHLQVLDARLQVGELEAPLEYHRESATVSGELTVPAVARWWPHTHGGQPRYGAAVIVRTDAGEVRIDLGRLAFRQVEAVTEDGGFALRINDQPIFCRGACWTTTDVVTLVSHDEQPYRAALQLARDAGMNMLRIAGTNAYESDAFYELCDELGILIWQDFMFANMDYPSDDAFLNSVRREVQCFLGRTQTRACLAVLCGGSEVEQQVAMLGLPRELWRIPLFREHIPAECRTLRPDVPYCPSSPSGGALPFHVNTGIAHYYGVGAYLRPLEDARRAEVRFAAECLAFANIPEEATLESFIGGGVMTPQHARWKERAPRDAGGSWDFDDVRDHYLERLFAVDARLLRTTDLERYLTLGRAVTGEVMASVFGEWRRARSTCRGGIVFAYQDFWPGAGFGVVDALGRPKAAYYYLKRAFAPVALLASDEGSNGVVLHGVNDTARPIEAELRVDLYRHGQVPVVGFTRAWRLNARASEELVLDQELEHFIDSAYAYRFGPPTYDVLVATLRVENTVLAEAYFFPVGMALPRQVDIGLRGAARKVGDGHYEVVVSTTSFAQSVCIDAGAYIAADNWFHLGPGGSRTVQLRSAPGGPFSATLQALNAFGVARVAAAPTTA